MGDFQAPLQNLLYLASVPPIARVMTKLDTWAPQLRSGREVQTKTVLGPALSITSLPDIDWHFGKFVSTTQPQPNVALTLFRNAETRSAEVNSPAWTKPLVPVSTSQIQRFTFETDSGSCVSLLHKSYNIVERSLKRKVILNTGVKAMVSSSKEYWGKY